MTRTYRPMLSRLGAAICAWLAAAAAQTEAAPPVWMFPPRTQNGQSLRQLFEHPEAWPQTRARLDGIGYPDQPLRHQFSESDLRAWFPLMRQWHLKLEVMAGAVKEWGPTADISFPKGAHTWDILMSYGAPLARISLDEPLNFTIHSKQGTVDDAAEQTARYVAFVRQRYPALAIGDIEPYPALSSGQLLDFLDQVQGRLRQWHVRGLDFFRLDVNWVHFMLHDRLGAGGWDGVSALEGEVHRRGLPFELIYWAANYPSVLAAGDATDETWEQEIMDQGARYAATGATPDSYYIDSWVQMTNPAVPESQPGTFTRSVLDFTGRFVPGAANHN